MIVSDINLLVYAYNADSPFHQGAKRWWESALSGNESVGLPWLACLGFQRLMMNRKVCLIPMEPLVVLGHIRSWLELPHVH